MGELHIDADNDRFWIEVDTSGFGVTDTIGIVRDLADQDGVELNSTRSLVCFDGRGLPDLRDNSQGDTCEPPDGFVIFSLRAEVDTLEITALGKVISCLERSGIHGRGLLVGALVEPPARTATG